MKKLLVALALVGAVVLARPAPARAHVSFGLSLPGFGLFINEPGPPPAYYGPPVYYSPPAYYPPAPVYYGYGRYGYGRYGYGRPYYRHHGGGHRGYYRHRGGYGYRY